MVGSLAWVGATQAHPEFNPTRTNRYLKLTLVGDEVRVVYSVLYGQGPAAVALRAADLDANGQVDGDEVKKLGAGLQERVHAGLSLRIDGLPAAVEFETPSIGFLGGAQTAEVAPNPFTVDLVARLKLKSLPQHELVVDDHTELSDLGENEIRLEESPNTELVATQRGALISGVATRETRFVFVGPRQSVIEDRAVAARWRKKAGTSLPGWPRRWWWLLLGIGGVGLAGLARWRASRRRRARS